MTNYSIHKHFDGDFGAGLKIYPVHDFFIRPEARIYLDRQQQLIQLQSYAHRFGALYRLHLR